MLAAISQAWLDRTKKELGDVVKLEDVVKLQIKDEARPGHATSTADTKTREQRSKRKR